MGTLMHPMFGMAPHWIGSGADFGERLFAVYGATGPNIEGDGRGSGTNFVRIEHGVYD